MVVDIVIGAIIALFAWRCLMLERSLHAILYFIAFGLLVAIAWVRLGAPDVAIAEAAIGAGLTGAMFLTTLRRINHSSGKGSDVDDG